jgi:acyl phosphate:glycerol-3-phosphate acyltransferase
MQHWFWYAVLGYVCGSIPFGLLLTRAAGLGDIRSIGSGNIGATNVLRTGNRKIAALTLLCDALKGFLPVLLATCVAPSPAALAAAGSAVAGHLFPVWLGFKGGKGVATSVGVLFGLYWVLGLLFLVLWLAFAFLFRISSLSALLASALTPALAWYFGRGDLVLPTAVLAVVIWIMHRENIIRLWHGTESKISLGKKP